MRNRRLYHDDMYRFNDPPGSYWEATAGEPLRCEPLASDDRCEVAVIGGGYTGLSAAYHLASGHGIEARVLEAGHIGWGASGRNGGFCSLGGSSLGTREQLSRYGQDDVRHYYRSQVEAVELVRQIITDENIDAQATGDVELRIAHSPKAFEEIKQQAGLRRDLLGLDTEVLSAEQCRASYFDSTELCGASTVRPTFGLHPMRYILGLAAAAQRRGVTLHPHSEIVAWDRQGGNHVLRTRSASLTCRRVIMATNGYMPESIHSAFVGRPMPMISAIVVTRPLSAAERSAHRWNTTAPAVNSRRLLNYFRLLPDNRFLFGGRGSSTGSNAAAADTYDRLVARLRTLWPHWADAAIDYRWHGLVCFTRRQTPSIGRLTDDPSVFFGFGFHGNGVNTATWTGKQLADWLAKRSPHDPSYPDTLPVMVRGLSPRFPLPALRRYYLQAMIATFRAAEALSEPSAKKSPMLNGTSGA